MKNNGNIQNNNNDDDNEGKLSKIYQKRIKKKKEISE